MKEKISITVAWQKKVGKGCGLPYPDTYFSVEKYKKGIDILNNM